MQGFFWDRHNRKLQEVPQKPEVAASITVFRTVLERGLVPLLQRCAIGPDRRFCVANPHEPRPKGGSKELWGQNPAAVIEKGAEGQIETGTGSE